jgi:MFS family permease
MQLDARRRWLALIVLCLGVLMIVLDTTIVNVALPSIKQDLQFTDASLVWVVNAYMLTFGGFLLLGGRLGDLFGHRRLFLAGIVLFTAASLACGLAQSQAMLVAARAVQGIGGAVVTSVALSLIMMLFVEPAERAKAMGVYGFVCAGGGSVGVLLGGLLTSTLNWHWIFLVNLPIGLLVLAWCLRLLPGGSGHAAGGKLDVAGAVTVTSALMLAVYAIVNGNETGWTAPQTLGMLAAAVVLLGAFLVIESRVREPLMPLGMFRLRNVAAANIVGVLWAAAMFAWFFLTALYMQLVLGYGPMQVGLRSCRQPDHGGVLARAVGEDRHALRHPRSAVRGAGAGRGGAGAVRVRAGRWIVRAARAAGDGAARVRRGARVQSGAARGDERRRAGGRGTRLRLVNTSFMMGGALGLAVLASIAAARTAGLQATGVDAIASINGGYHVAFLLGALCAAGAGLFGFAVIRARMPDAAQHDGVPVPAD